MFKSSIREQRVTEAIKKKAEKVRKEIEYHNHRCYVLNHPEVRGKVIMPTESFKALNHKREEMGNFPLSSRNVADGSVRP
ncbi:MAG: hypothetical protein ABSG44_20940 [Thermodesulfobacteriota bacterium]|jgi:NAD-dependent DNA ligase